MTKTILYMFADEDMKKKIESFPFPRVEVGKEHLIEFWIYNDSKKWKMEIFPVFEIETESETVEFLNLPAYIKPLEKRKITMRWKPSTQIDDVLTGWAGIRGRLLIG
jgi:hypothetical protein